MFIIITGAPGSGKTNTAKQLFEGIDKSALVDGDWLLATTPHDHGDQRHLRYKNIASVARNYYEGGFKTVFISFVYVNQDDLSEQIELLNDLAPVRVFALVPREEILRKRHVEDTYKREPIDSAVNLNNMIKSLSDIEIIDNSDISIEETVNVIKQNLNL